MSEILRNYEMVVIAASQLDDEGLATLTQRVSGWITGANGTVSETNVWGRRSLMYPIKKQTEGIYVQFNFELAPSASRELERSLRLDEQIIRHLVIRLDED
jgi:small subunit ribosomal protein S6